LVSAAPRNADDSAQYTEWVKRFVKPVHDAEAKLANARKHVNKRKLEAKDKGKKKVPPAVAERCLKEAEARELAAKGKRDKVVAGFKQDIGALPSDHEVVLMWHNAGWLKSQPFSLALAQFDDVNESVAVQSLLLTVKGAWELKQEEAHRMQKIASDRLKQLRADKESSSSHFRQTSANQTLLSDIEEADRKLDEAVQSVAEADISFAQICREVNEEDGLFIWTAAGKNPKLLKPHIRPLELKLTLL
jgi:uncharacterized protein YaaR (DUF327 family)